MPRPTSIALSDLPGLLEREIRRATPITFIALTEPEQKASPFGGRVKKLCRVNAMAGCRFSNAMAKAGEQASEERAWGERREPALVTRQTKDGRTAYYLPVQLNHVSRPLYLVPNQATGKLRAVASEAVKPYLRPDRPAVVAYRDFSLSSLVAIHLNGRRLRILPA